MQVEMVDTANVGTVIKVIGVGGAGGNAIQHMINKGVSGVEFIVANTDAQALAHSSADNIIQIGETGLGAGMRPEIGRELAEASRERIEDALRGAHMVFIAAGMGKGTGTGASPVIAEIAKSLGALTVAVVSKPFSFEGNRSMKIAEEGLMALGPNVDSLIVIKNERLEEEYEDATMEECFQHADDVLNNAVAGIAEIINTTGRVNVDFNDVKTIMSAKEGKAMMGIGIASGVDRARLAAENATKSPLLDGVELSHASGVLVNITTASPKLKEVKEIMATVNDFASPDALIVHGQVVDPGMGEEIRVTVIATGLGQSMKKPEIELVKRPIVIEEEQQGTGTDGPYTGMWQRRSQPVEAEAVGAPPPEIIDAMQEIGIEPTDIPAFLRKQAD